MNGLTTSGLPRVDRHCRYCGKKLGFRAIVSQVIFGCDGRDYCRACKLRHALSQMPSYPTATEHGAKR